MEGNALRADCWAPLGNLARLETLNVAENHIEDIPVCPRASFAQLRELQCSDNRITCADGISSMTGLVSLDLCANWLTALPDTSRLRGLVCFRADNNPETSVFGYGNSTELWLQSFRRDAQAIMYWRCWIYTAM
jgi:Leucine-rich repeat (LRR) protein